MNDVQFKIADDTTIEASARRRIARRLLPFLIILFAIAYVDRVNVSYAGLQMTKDLNFDPEVFGFGAGIFFIGYFILEIPGTLLVERWSARKWLARIIISWGFLAVLMGFIQSTTQFYVVRFLLGLAEAGFFPGIIVYLSHWFRYRERARAIAAFMTALPISVIFAAPISGLILGVNWFGLAGWRWVFILEGIPAVVLGIATIFYLTDRPQEATWLSEDERSWIIDELENENRIRKSVKDYTVWQALRHRNVILLALAYFCSINAVYGLAFWLPTILQRLSDYSNFQIATIAALPYCAALVAMIAVGWSSDRRNERRWHAALSLFAVSIGFFLAAATQQNIVLSLAMFCLAGAGLYGALPAFWSLPAAFLSESAAAASIGLINSIGNLGGFVGPFIVGYIVKATGSFYGGIIYLSCSALASGLLILAVRSQRKSIDSN